MNKLDNPSTFSSNDIVVVRFVNEINTCEDCQKVKVEIESLQKENKLGEIIVFECKDDTFDEIEKTEYKLREVANKWPYFGYVICGWFKMYLQSRFRYFADKKNSIKIWKEYGVVVEGRPPSDFDKDIK